MAELRDWLNRTVLYIHLPDASLSPVGEVRIVFQRNVFIDNETGWRDETEAEIRFYKFCFNQADINQFVTEAKHWLSLPLSSLGTTFFAGTWGLGAHETHRFDLTFQPYHSTPSKTDWFMVHVTIRSDAVAWEENLHVDYTCLALFIDGLCSYYPRSPA